MDTKTKKHINFRFAKCWKSFLEWYNLYMSKANMAPHWNDQKSRIEFTFEHFNSGVVNWKQLWKDLELWFKEMKQKGEIVTWKSQQRQIETLMLNQLSELNKEQFVLAFLNRGIPDISERMTYFDAIRVKKDLGGNSNGEGGNENIDRITIVNLSSLIE